MPCPAAPDRRCARPTGAGCAEPISGGRMIEGPETWVLLAISAVLVLLLLTRPELTRQRGGKMLAFVGLLLLPALVAWAGFARHLEISKTREFCLSCHVMHPY